MTKLGLAAGTVLFGLNRFMDARETRIDTPHGEALIFVGEDFAFVPRHGKEGGAYIMPHRINHAANLTALKEVGVDSVLGIYSTGSLLRSLVPGTIVVPDDFIALCDASTEVIGEERHMTPAVSDAMRTALIQAGRNAEVEIRDGGVYWQNRGPRLETKAEIRMMAQFAQLVGMTMAGEAVTAMELGLPFVALCSVDNYANGLTAQPLSEAAIRDGAAKNARVMLRVVDEFMSLRRHGKFSL
jgi:5'-methylthioadenosine phosphorylase